MTSKTCTIGSVQAASASLAQNGGGQRYEDADNQQECVLHEHSKCSIHASAGAFLLDREKEGTGRKVRPSKEARMPSGAELLSEYGLR
jgi:hypothetical protein